MITYKPIIVLAGRRRDGTYPVKIRVTFKGVVRRLPTTLVCTDNDITRSGKIKNATTLQRAGELIAQMREACADLSPFTLASWTVDDVVAHIRETLAADSFRMDLFVFADEFLKGKQPTTRRAYGTALAALERFLGERRLDVNDITRKLLLEFVDYVEAEPKMKQTKAGYVRTDKQKIEHGASSRHVAKLAHIFAAAKAKYNDEDLGRIVIPRSPFDGIRKVYPATQGQRNLGVEVMQAIIDAQPVSRLEGIALAAFVTSFALMGANLADLYEAKATKSSVWVYNRKKTASRRADRAEVRVLLPERLRPVLARIGYLSGGAWLFPALHHWKPESITAMINRLLSDWAGRNGVEVFTFYAARHTWASLARKIGVEKATVDEALAHVGDFRVTDIYAERNWELAWAANDKVLDLFSWPTIEAPPKSCPQ